MGIFTLEPVERFTLRVEQVMREMQAMQSRVEATEDNIDQSPDTAEARCHWAVLEPLRIVRNDLTVGVSLLLDIAKFDVEDRAAMRTGEDRLEYNQLEAAVTRYEYVAYDHRRTIGRAMRSFTNQRILGKISRLASRFPGNDGGANTGGGGGGGAIGRDGIRGRPQVSVISVLSSTMIERDLRPAEGDLFI